MIIGLGRVAQLVAELDRLRKRMGADKARTITLARQAVTLHRTFVLVDEIGEAGYCAEPSRVTEIGEDIVAADRPRPRTVAVDPPNGVDAPSIGHIGLKFGHAGPFAADGVEGL